MRKFKFNLKSVLLGTLIVVCFCSCGKDTSYYIKEETAVTESASEDPLDANETEEASSKEQIIYVYVCGQVQKPGVYTLPEGSRVYDAFFLAGGLAKEAATDYWNQARILKDGEMIYVPTKDEAKERTFEEEAVSDVKQNTSGKININTASKEELMTIPGVGEAKAAAILAYRNEHGSFSSIEELKQVDGIKDGVFSKMKDYIEI